MKTDKGARLHASTLQPRMDVENNENIEIERKFLMASLPPEIESLEPVSIEQGYLNLDKLRTTRVRVTSEGQAFLTVKGKSVGATRVEIETPIDPVKARAMLDLCEGAIVSKLRRKIHHAGKTWEVDVFLGANAGLVVAEIELRSEGESFVRPSWVGPEVTEESCYSNASLSKVPYSEWNRKERHPLKASKP